MIGAPARDLAHPRRWLMPRPHRVLSLAVLCLVMAVGSAMAAPQLKRGINFEVWQTWIGRDAFLAPDFDRARFPDWMGRIDDRQLARLKGEGFDFVRLNIDAAALLWAGDDGAGPLIDRAVSATARLQALGFTVIVDMHLLPADEERPDGLEDVIGTSDHHHCSGIATSPSSRASPAASPCCRQT
jgi:hypothetical protein